MNTNFRYIVLVLVLMAFSCGPKKGIATKKKHDKNKTETAVIKEEAKTEVALAPRLPPIKSISSSSCSLVLVVVPLRSMFPTILT